DTTWDAIQGRSALEITWDNGVNAQESSATLRAKMEQATLKPGKVIFRKGDPDPSYRATTIEAVYDVPFQAHAALEPANATAHVTKTGCEVWAPTQFPSWAHRSVMQATGLPKDAMHIPLPY